MYIQPISIYLIIKLDPADEIPILGQLEPPKYQQSPTKNDRPVKTDGKIVESSNGTFRAECLDTNWFQSLPEVRRFIEAWRQ